MVATETRTKRIVCSHVWGGTSEADEELSTPSLRVHLYSSSASGRAGGDIYYLSVCENDMISRVAIADVAGHGEAVNALSEWMYDALLSRMDHFQSSDVLVDLNDVANERGLHAMTTAAVLSYRSDVGVLNYCYAGHPPILLSRSTEREWRELPIASSPGSNWPLAVEPGTPYDELELRLSAGDRFLLYTDGLSEAMNPDGEQFGERRLGAILEDANDASLSEIKDRLVHGLHAHAGLSPQDDVTLVLAEVI